MTIYGGHEGLFLLFFWGLAPIQEIKNGENLIFVAEKANSRTSKQRGSNGIMKAKFLIRKIKIVMGGLDIF